MTGSIASFASEPALVDEVATFAAAVEVGDLPEDLDERFAALVAYERALHEAGLAVVAWPEHLGGRGLSAADAALVAAELGARSAPELVNFVAIEVVAPALLAHATQDQLLRWLPPMAPADEVWCQLFSEPDAGSDLASLTTRAVRDGGSWVLSGQKVWCTWGQYARRGLVLARTGSTESRHRGITAFVLEMGAPGVEVRPLRTMTGVSEFTEVFLDGARVPDDDRVGAEGGGWRVALSMLAAERGTYAVRRASVIRATLATLQAQARASRLPPPARAAVIQATIDLHLLDLNIASLVRSMAGQGGPAPDAALTKTSLTRAEQSVFACAQELLGLDGVGWIGRQPSLVEGYLYARAASIYGGSSQIQRNIVGERLLGLPREPS